MTPSPTPIHRILVSLKPVITNPKIKMLMRTINEYFDVTIEEVAINDIYAIDKPLSLEQIQDIAKGPLIDPRLEESRIG